MKKKEIEPISEKRFRLMLFLSTVAVLSSAFLIADGNGTIVLVGLIVILMTASSPPERYLDLIGNSFLKDSGWFLILLAFLSFAGYIALERMDYLILAAFAYTLFSAVFFTLVLQQASKARFKKESN